MKQYTVNDKLKRREITAYAFGNVGYCPVQTIISSYLMIFYTNIVGINPAAVATLFMLSTIFDAITDPITGWIMDNSPHTKWGHLRPFAIIGSLVCAINMILLFFGPLWVPGAKYLIVYATYFLMGIAYDFVDTPITGMLTNMTADNTERNKLSVAKIIGTTVGAIFVGVAAPLILKDATKIDGYYPLIFGGSLFVVILCSFSLCFCHERVVPQKAEDSKYTLAEEIKMIGKGPVLVYLISLLINGIGNTIGSQVGTYFYTYVIGDLTVSSIIAVISIVCLVPGIALSTTFVKKLGKKGVFLFLSIANIICLAIRLIDVRSVVLMCISNAIATFATGLYSTVVLSLIGELCDYIEFHMRKHANAAITALYSFLTKAGKAIGGAIPGYLLAMTMFDEKAAVQNEATINVIILCSVILPTAFIIISSLFFVIFYPLSKKKSEELVQQLAERRQAEAIEN